MSTGRLGSLSQTPSRLRVSLISHAYSEPGYRAKLEFISNAVALELVAPFSFAGPYGNSGFRPDSSQNYKTRLFEVAYPLGLKTSTRWVLRSWDLGFRHFRPDVVHVENEIHSFILIQAIVCRALFARNAKLIVFVWANLPLTGVRGFVLNRIASLLW